MKQHLTAMAYLSRGKKTYLNMTEAVLEHYNASTRKIASSMGAQLRSKRKFENHLQELAEEMGMGIKVRLGMAAEVAKGLLRTRTITKTYVRDEHGKLILEGQTETESEPSASERIRALLAIDRATGHDEAIKRDTGEAKRELDRMYTEAFTPEVLEAIEAEIVEENNDPTHR